ncbi:MAG: helix-turn-helix domain-containing protein [Candidatus Limivicinus sp.]
MNTINAYIGGKIRNYRKMKKMTLQQLADAVHKSRATVCKYESGEISLDIETLYEISRVLDVELNQLTDYQPEAEELPPASLDFGGESPFFKADKLYFYFYDGRYDRLKEALIHVHKKKRREDGSFDASMFIRYTTPMGHNTEVYYTGDVLYSDTLIRFSFLNRCNKLEQDLLYIFNPLELRDFTDGLLCGISSVDLMPCAFKCMVSLSPRSDYKELRRHLALTARELHRWQKLNMFTVGNEG